MATPIVEERTPVRPSNTPSTADTTEPSQVPKSLLRTKFPVDDVRCLPFVRNRSGKRTWWNPSKAFPGLPPQEQGTLCAAAYREFQQLGRPDHGFLVAIVQDFPVEQTLAEVYFCRFLEITMHSAISGGKQMRFENYAKALINSDRKAEAFMAALPESPDHPSHAEALRLCQVLGCTLRDLIGVPEAYTGGGQ